MLSESGEMLNFSGIFLKKTETVIAFTEKI